MSLLTLQFQVDVPTYLHDDPQEEELLHLPMAEQSNKRAMLMLS
jgi:hypothetical protein